MKLSTEDVTNHEHQMRQMDRLESMFRIEMLQHAGFEIPDHWREQYRRMRRDKSASFCPLRLVP